MTQLQDHDPYTTMFRALRDYSDPDVTPPPGAAASIARAITRLRSANAPEQHVAIAEQASLGAHRLYWAVIERDAARAAEIREDFGNLLEAWLDTSAGSEVAVVLN